MAISARYWRLYATAHNDLGNYTWASYTLAFYESQNCTGTDVAQGKTATASGEYRPASNANDGDEASSWYSGYHDSSTPSWWYFDAGSGNAVTICSLKMYKWGSLTPAGANLQYSNDASSWITVASISPTEEGSNVWQTFTGLQEASAGDVVRSGLSMPYSLRHEVRAPLSMPYELSLNKVRAGLGMPYSLRHDVRAGLSMPYSLRHEVRAPLAMPYSLGGDPVRAGLSMPYTLRSAVRAGLDMPYSMAVVRRSFSFPYALRSEVRAGLDMPYSMTTAVRAGLGMPYALMSLNPVRAGLDMPYAAYDSDPYVAPTCSVTIWEDA